MRRGGVAHGLVDVADGLLGRVLIDRLLDRLRIRWRRLH
jgi:hypothetical protein